jgi:hypothetical protein
MGHEQGLEGTAVDLPPEPDSCFPAVFPAVAQFLPDLAPQVEDQPVAGSALAAVTVAGEFYPTAIGPDVPDVALSQCAA